MRRLLSIFALISIAGTCCTAPAFAGGIGGFIPGAGLVRIPVTSLRDQRFAGIVRQQTDYSCGAAALATILDDTYGKTLTEYQTIVGMLGVSNYQTVRERGFSLLDMKHYVETLGMQGIGYRMTLEMLYKVKVPAIVLLTVEGYQHFVVLKNATPQYVYVADPMLGNRAVPTQEFASSWNGILFVVAAPGYQRTSALADVPLFVGSGHLAAGMPPQTYALANAVLMTVFIPPATRL